MALNELPGTDKVLLRLGTILFIIAMAVYLYRLARRHIAEVEHKARSGH